MSETASIGSVLFVVFLVMMLAIGLLILAAVVIANDKDIEELKKRCKSLEKKSKNEKEN